MSKRKPNWRLDLPSLAQRDILQTDMKLTLIGSTQEEIKASFEDACLKMGWKKSCSCGGNPHTTTCPMKPQDPDLKRHGN